MKLFDFFKDLNKSDLIKIFGGLIVGMLTTFSFFLTPIAHLPLLWIYGEEAEFELLNPTSLNVGDIADIKIVITPKTFLGLSSGAVTFTVDDNFLYKNKKQIITFTENKGPIIIFNSNVKIKANRDGIGQIRVLLKTENKPDGYDEKTFTIPISERQAKVVSRDDFTGEWKISIHGNMGIMKITDSNQVLGGIFEFEKPFWHKLNGNLGGIHDGGFVEINLNYGEMQRIHISGTSNYYPASKSVELIGTAYLQTQKSNKPGFWDDEKQLPFKASAILASRQ